MASAWVHISGPNPKPASRRAQPRCISASNPKPKYGSRPNGYLTPTLHPHLGEPSRDVSRRAQPSSSISAKEAPFSAEPAEKALGRYLGEVSERGSHLG